MDGFLYYTYNPQVKNAATWPFDAPQFIILNVAMGGIYPIDPNFVESEMEIDYVRVYQNVNVGVEESELPQLNVFPNPTSGSVFIEIEETVDRVEVLNMNGVAMPASLEGNHVDLKHLSDGVYILKVYTEQGVVTQKVVKQE